MMAQLTCSRCREVFDYTIEDELCKNCGKPIADPGIRKLVLVLSGAGFAVRESSEGVSFDEGDDFPWVAFYSLSDEEKERLRSIIGRYNNGPSQRKLIPWTLEVNHLSGILWLIPSERYRRTETLRRESEILADFISNHVTTYR